MSERLEAMREAARRGILPEDMRPAFDEAVRRGLIPPVEGAAAAPAPAAPEPSLTRTDAGQMVWRVPEAPRAEGDGIMARVGRGIQSVSDAIPDPAAMVTRGVRNAGVGLARLPLDVLDLVGVDAAGDAADAISRNVPQIDTGSTVENIGGDIAQFVIPGALAGRATQLGVQALRGGAPAASFGGRALESLGIIGGASLADAAVTDPGMDQSSLTGAIYEGATGGDIDNFSPMGERAMLGADNMLIAPAIGVGAAGAYAADRLVGGAVSDFLSRLPAAVTGGAATEWAAGRRLASAAPSDETLARARAASDDNVRVPWTVTAPRGNVDEVTRLGDFQARMSREAPFISAMRRNLNATEDGASAIALRGLPNQPGTAAADELLAMVEEAGGRVDSLEELLALTRGNSVLATPRTTGEISTEAAEGVIGPGGISDRLSQTRNALWDQVDQSIPVPTDSAVAAADATLRYASSTAPPPAAAGSLARDAGVQPVPGMGGVLTPPRPIPLGVARRQQTALGDQASTAIRSGAREGARELGGLRNAIDNDIASIPGGAPELEAARAFDRETWFPTMREGVTDRLLSGRTPPEGYLEQGLSRADLAQGLRRVFDNDPNLMPLVDEFFGARLAAARGGADNVTAENLDRFLANARTANALNSFPEARQRLQTLAGDLRRQEDLLTGAQGDLRFMQGETNPAVRTLLDPNADPQQAAQQMINMPSLLSDLQARLEGAPGGDAALANVRELLQRQFNLDIRNPQALRDPGGSNTIANQEISWGQLTEALGEGSAARAALQDAGVFSPEEWAQLDRIRMQRDYLMQPAARAGGALPEESDAGAMIRTAGILNAGAVQGAAWRTAYENIMSRIPGGGSARNDLSEAITRGVFDPDEYARLVDAASAGRAAANPASNILRTALYDEMLRALSGHTPAQQEQP